MSEQLPKSGGEQLRSPDNSAELERKNLEKLRERAEADAEKQADSGKVEHLAKSAAEQAVSGKELNPGEGENKNSAAPTFVSRELKAMAFNRSLNTARRQMRAPSRAFSKVIHQPVVEKVSDAVGASVARPSGILGGGIFAVLGSGILLYLVKHYGYEYNYLMFGVLFVGGFMVGMVVEGFVRAIFRHKS